MDKPALTIQRYMTPTPLTVGKERTIEQASQLMHEINARHLPVVDGHKLIGIVSARDLSFIKNLVGICPDTLTVGDAMTLDPYTVAPDALLDEVAEVMAAKKYGAVVVVQTEEVVGIFTAVDALSALTDVLRTKLAF